MQVSSMESRQKWETASAGKLAALVNAEHAPKTSLTPAGGSKIFSATAPLVTISARAGSSTFLAYTAIWT